MRAKVTDDLITTHQVCVLLSHVEQVGLMRPLRAIANAILDNNCAVVA
jgi:hypothetical protein